MVLLAVMTACSRERDPLARLAAEVAKLDQRPTVARFTGLPHRPAPRQSRRTVNAIRSSVFRGVTAESAATRPAYERYAAVAQVLTGRPRRAVESLTAMVRREPNDAAIWSDLAAAQYELALAENDPGLHAAALASADHALRLDASSQDARFNRALSLAALSLDPAAVRAFDSYRAIDSTSEWAAEAMQRAAALRRPNRTEQWNAARVTMEKGQDVEAIAKSFPQYARTFAESDYLARWAEAFTAGDTSTASHWLAIARAVGAARVRQFGDTFLADTVASIDAASRPAALAQAHLTYRRGRKMYMTEVGRVLDALPVLAEAERQFAAAGSPMDLVAGYYRANGLVNAQQLEPARASMDRVLERTPARYRALRAQLDWLRSTIDAVSGQPYASLDAALRSADEFRRIGEDENAARMENSATTALRRLGRVKESRALRSRVFASASAAGKASVWEVALNTAARDEILERRWDVAASLFAVESESEIVSPRVRVDALLWGAVAEAHANGGRMPDLRAARAATGGIKDAAVREEVERELDFVEGASLTQSDAVRAAQLLTKVVDYRLRTANFVRLSAAYLERARAHVTARRPADAEADLRAALAADERVGRSIERDDFRDSFFGGIDDAYEELIELLVGRGQLADAVDVAERFRARGLAESDARRQEVARSIDAIAAAAPRDALIVHYTTLRSGTLVSVVRDRRHRESVIGAPRARIAASTERLLRAVERDDGIAERQNARELYDLLIAPIAGELSGHASVVVVPDETIAAIPLAMLVAPSGRYLVEDFVLVHAANASMFVRHASETPVAHDRRARMAIVADPEIDPHTFPSLERLPAAHRDSRWLASTYASEVLAGKDATATRVEAALAKSDVAHLATHAIADRGDAWRSLLVLAPEPRSDGALYLHQIARLNLHQLRLVTLAGCRTGTFGGGRGSVRSLSRAFLAAGAHNVVATLWNVEDTATSKMTQEFFRARDQGLTPAAALQQAQVTMLRSGDPGLASPRTWASLQLQGCNR
jgi:CHAT domain-containing protein